MASADEGEKDEWYNRLHYGDQVKLDRRQENLERARSHRGAQALSYVDRSVPLPQLLCRKLESTWRDQLEEFGPLESDGPRLFKPRPPSPPRGPKGPRYLPYISPISPLYLPGPSPRRQGSEGCNPNPNPDPGPN